MKLYSVPEKLEFKIQETGDKWYFESGCFAANIAKYTYYTATLNLFKCGSVCSESFGTFDQAVEAIRGWMQEIADSMLIQSHEILKVGLSHEGETAFESGMNGEPVDALDMDVYETQRLALIDSATPWECFILASTLPVYERVQRAKSEALKKLSESEQKLLGVS